MADTVQVLLEKVAAGTLDPVKAGALLKVALKPSPKTPKLNPQGTEYDTKFRRGTFDEVSLAAVSGKITNDDYAGILKGLGHDGA